MPPAGQVRSMIEHRRVERLVCSQAQQRPWATAIVDVEGSHTYGALDRLSNQIARSLVDQGVRRGDRVCLLVPKTGWGIASIVAVMKAGAVYVPLDPFGPLVRSARIVEMCAPCALLAEAGLVDLATSIKARVQVSLQPSVTCLEVPSGAESDGDVSVASRSEDLAYILFTSGSTGTPKGVPITHLSFMRHLLWANSQFQLGPEDRISGHSPLHFDMSGWDIFGALGSGATLCPVPPDVGLLPNLTAEFIRQRCITQLFAVPSALVSMTVEGIIKQGDFEHLRRLIWCGEVFPNKALRHWMQRLPHVTFVNTYGPTEATIFCTYHVVDACPSEGDLPVPIGRPIPGMRAMVVDDGRREVRAGVVGELCVAGTGLSPGYWRESDRTGKAFGPIPADPAERWYRTGDLVHVDEHGVLHFHGRNDRQIKCRGHRIELDEVAVSLARVRGIVECAVVAVHTDEWVGTVICAAYVLERKQSLLPAALRTELATLIPRYMLPTRWRELESLPRGPNGKVDLRQLERSFGADD
jgi:amino acid adenylation domain-containing protein